MVDTYYDKMDRGLVPRLPGYQGYVARNPTLAPGQYVSAGGAYGRAGARPGAPSPRAALLAAQAKLLKEANAANEARYQQGLQLLEMPDPLAWQKAGFASESAYQQHQAVKAQEAANIAASTAAFGGSPGGAGLAEAAARGARVQAKQRGIYNSSSALNDERRKYDRELAEQDYRNRAFGLQEMQVNDQMRRGRAAEADSLRQQQLAWIYGKNDQAPNLDRSTQIAAVEGEGNTEGMAYPVAGGGGGGGGGGYGGPIVGGSGYGMPGFGLYSPQAGTRRRRVAPRVATTGQAVGGLGTAALYLAGRRTGAPLATQTAGVGGPAMMANIYNRRAALPLGIGGAAGAVMRKPLGRWT